ncbi:LPS export ABC transporter permease LptF [Salinarimonas ramus]|uniref:LPS export ABC transporter permease LptF n=1 Tax=Salinarimonas ramus TaxID=690164 RepID=A0A917Q726_9HYPH|nr:LPS export ABC transporter permease LptF [Salinarimonas ramus]GGK31671.1 LPS export ABC transporter permease LptF [Salinarimonas ramus]
MTRIERYIFGTALNAFLSLLVGLTAVIWITQALRELDLITGKGQTFVVFLVVTGLSLPALVTVIAPVALFIAAIYTLNKLNSDSEWVVAAAAGMSPARLMRPFALLGGIVALVVALNTIWLMPASFAQLRHLITQIRADFVANLVREGTFTELDDGITFSYRDRAGDALLGIFLQDRRDPQRTVVYIAERGIAADVDDGSYLLLEKGSIHRMEQDRGDGSIVTFERYAVDLAAFGPEQGAILYKPREQSTAALIAPDPDDPYYQTVPGRFRAELHDRLTAWLYPIAGIAIAFAALGQAVTTRQGRGTAVAGAVIAMVVVRVAGFAASSAAVGTPAAVLAVWAAPVGGIALALWVALRPQQSAAVGARIGGALSALNPLHLLPAARRA